MIPNFNTDKELFDYLKANQQKLILQKKENQKEADSVGIITINQTDKASKQEGGNVDELRVVAVINTTNWLDSHRAAVLLPHPG